MVSGICGGASRGGASVTVVGVSGVTGGAGGVEAVGGGRSLVGGGAGGVGGVSLAVGTLPPCVGGRSAMLARGLLGAEATGMPFSSVSVRAVGVPRPSP